MSLAEGTSKVFGYQKLDGPHRLRCTKGIWWCGRCGCWATGRACKQSGRRGWCNRVLDGAVPCGGRYILGRLLAGNTPKPSVTWPDEAMLALE